MTFRRAYLRASAAASAVLIGFLLVAGLARPEFARVDDLLVLGPVLVLHVLLFTWLLGSFGLRVVAALGWERLPCFAGVGFVLGASLAAGIFMAQAPGYVAGAALLFGGMGAVAASTFRRFRPCGDG